MLASLHTTTNMFSTSNLFNNDDRPQCSPKPSDIWLVFTVEARNDTQGKYFLSGISSTKSM